MNIIDRLDRQYQMYENEYETTVLRVLKSGWYVLGPEVKAFEEEFAKVMGSIYCIGLNSGLDALIMGLRALDIGEGDEVIVPANTFIATVMAVTENKATPVFVEPDEYYNIDVDKIEEKITDKTKAIIAVHLYGQAANMDKIKQITQKHNLYLLEDCAQAHTAMFNGRKIGTWGDIGCFSFYPTKNLGAFGDAGAVITDNKEIEEKIRKIRNYGSGIKYHNELTGVNSRLDEIQAALLRTKLSHLDELIVQRDYYANEYLKRIKNDKLILPKIREGATQVWHLFVVRCQEREELKKYLEENDVFTQIHYPIPPHLQECYKDLGYKAGDFPLTEKFAKEILSLPIYNGMTDEELAYIIDVVNKF